MREEGTRIQGCHVVKLISVGGGGGKEENGSERCQEGSGLEEN